MKKALLIITPAIIISVALYLDNRNTFNSSIASGFGGRYKDSPYPFDDPSYPVRCRIKTYQVDFINIDVQQGKTHLKIPADALAFDGARKRADSKECVPIDISFKYIFFKGKLLRNGKRPTEAEKAGYVSHKAPKETHQFVEFALVSLLDSPEQAKAKAEKMRQELDEKIYSERMRMKHFPLWFFPYRDYVRQEKDNAMERKFNEERMRDGDEITPLKYTAQYGYGVVGSLNPITQQPHLVRCPLDRSVVPSRKPDTVENRKKMLDISKVANNPCLGRYYVVTDDTVLEVFVKVDILGIQNIDKIYQQLDGIIKDFIVKKPQIKNQKNVIQKI